MIKAYNAGYIKYDTEDSKRKNNYCIIEMTIESMPCIQLIIIGQDGLISAHLIDQVTEITGYHRYNATNGNHLGAGDLKPLDTSSDKGMLEGLSLQMSYNYSIMAKAFGEGLLKLTE